MFSGLLFRLTIQNIQNDCKVKKNRHIFMYNLLTIMYVLTVTILFLVSMLFYDFMPKWKFLIYLIVIYFRPFDIYKHNFFIYNNFELTAQKIYDKFNSIDESMDVDAVIDIIHEKLSKLETRKNAADKSQPYIPKFLYQDHELVGLI